MMSARLGVLGAAASALLVYGFSAAPGAQSAQDNAKPAAAGAMSAMPARIDNFMLVDAQHLEAHDLYGWPTTRRSC